MAFAILDDHVTVDNFSAQLLQLLQYNINNLNKSKKLILKLKYLIRN